jgi:hypothetical protein
MTDNTARQILETISASRTQALLDEIQATKELVRSHADIFRHKFEAVQEHLVEPLFDALGFDGRYRQRVPETPNQYVVLSQQDEIAYVLAHPLWVDLRYEDVAVTVRERTGFTERIILTDGFNWRIYDESRGDTPLHFTLLHPEGFSELFALGVKNFGP